MTPEEVQREEIAVGYHMMLAAIARMDFLDATQIEEIKKRMQYSGVEPHVLVHLNAMLDAIAEDGAAVM